MVRGLTYLELGAEIALSHHENFDGSGYPDGLRGAAIPLSARIVAVADTFEALVSERPYRPAFSQDQAMTMIETMAGSRFDPVVVEAFLDVMASPSLDEE
jgi:HD-GYP domain-containing protein (c-di-GMP phosphodiesterase class II)